MSSYTLRKSKAYLRHMVGLDYADAAPLATEQRSCLHNMYLNGICSNFSDGAAGNYTNLFMVALRATNTQIGGLAAVTQVLSALSPLPGAFIAERTGAYRATILWPSFMARAGFLLLAVLPLFQIGQPVIAGAIVIFAMRSFLQSLVGAPWTAAMGQMVPLRLRAGYFSARNSAGGLAVIAGTLLAGQIINALGFPYGYTAMYGLSAVIGFLASYIYARVPATAYGALEKPTRGPHTATQRLTLVSIFKQRAFIRYMLCACVFSFAVNIGSPFIGLYQVRVLGFGAATIGVLASAELAANIVMQRVYGTVLIPRFTDYRVMRLLRFATAVVPIAWLLVRDPFTGALVGAMTGVIWSGHDLANFNGLLEVAPESNRASYIALHTVTTSLSAALGPAIGGLLTDAIGYAPLFIASGVLRIVGALLLVILVQDWTRKDVN